MRIELRTNLRSVHQLRASDMPRFRVFRNWSANQIAHRFETSGRNADCPQLVGPPTVNPIRSAYSMQLSQSSRIVTTEIFGWLAAWGASILGPRYPIGSNPANGVTTTITVRPGNPLPLVPQPIRGQPTDDHRMPANSAGPQEKLATPLHPPTRYSPLAKNGSPPMRLLRR